VDLDYPALYRLTLTDGACGVGGVQDMVTTSNVRLDASAVTQVGIEFQAVHNGQSFIGGAGDDLVHVQDPEDHSNRLDGGAGDGDELRLEKSSNRVVLHAADMRNFEILSFEGHVATCDANVAAGQTLQVNVLFGGGDFDGHRETDGTFAITGVNFDDTLTGGRGADTIDGASGDDVITGGKGADLLSGYLGADPFEYRALIDSTHLAFDTITDLDSSDTIDLHHIDADTTRDGNQHFRLVSQFHDRAGELTLTYHVNGDYTQLGGDVDGDGKVDFVVHMDGDQTGFEGFVL
jgi:Ca2+-binding RTX toxin-like protein